MRRLIIAAAFAGVLGGRAIGAQAPLTAQDVAEIEAVVTAHVGQRLEGRAPVFDPQVRNGQRRGAGAGDGKRAARLDGSEGEAAALRSGEVHARD